MSLCGCGCGSDAGIYPRTHTAKGIIKGQPRRFLHGHQPRGVFGSGSDLSRYRVEDRGYATPCRIWTGPSNQKGYGLVKVGRSSRAAHLVAYEQANGPIPEGRELDHLCRVRACVNLAHLEVVTHKVNMERSANQKLRPEDRSAIRALATASGMSVAALARHFGFSRPTIRTVLDTQ